jgi:hypothetical protein
MAYPASHTVDSIEPSIDEGRAMASTQTSIGEAVFCRARLNYLPRTPGDGAEQIEVAMYDGRQAALPGWEVCGFELRRHESAVRDWDDDARIAEHHYGEIAALAKALSGCDHALVSRHIRRSPQDAARHPDLGPIAFVHSDFAESYGELLRQSYRDPRPAALAALEREGTTPEAVTAARRLMVLQFWRNTGPARMDMPLGFCDARSVPVGDVRPIPVTNYAGEGFDFEALAIVAPDDPDAHRWFAFPEMEHDEVVVFRTYDTDRVTRREPFWTPHSAFADPKVPLGQPSRCSIELRATCLFM